jgi:hypothetical protein
MSQAVRFETIAENDIIAAARFIIQRLYETYCFSVINLPEIRKRTDAEFEKGNLLPQDWGVFIQEIFYRGVYNEQNEKIESYIRDHGLFHAKFTIPIQGNIHWDLSKKGGGEPAGFQHQDAIVSHARYLIIRLYVVYRLFEIRNRNTAGIWNTENGFKNGNLIPSNWRRFIEVSFSTQIDPQINEKMESIIDEHTKKQTLFVWTEGKPLRFDLMDDFDGNTSIRTFAPDMRTLEEKLRRNAQREINEQMFNKDEKERRDIMQKMGIKQLTSPKTKKTQNRTR